MVAIAAGKTYLTVGGYVVEIINNDLHSSERTAAGITIAGRNILEVNRINGLKDGWYYEEDGTVNALNEEWKEKLKIVEELPFPIPNLPEGFDWADSFPQLREIKEGEHYISNAYHLCPTHFKDISPTILDYNESTPAVCEKMGKKRFALIKKVAVDPLIAKYGEPKEREPVMTTNYSPYPRYYKHKDDAFVDNIKYIKRVNEFDRHNILTDGSTVDTGNSWSKYGDDYVARGIWVEVPESKVNDFIASCTPTATATATVATTFDYPRYYKHRDDGFSIDLKYIQRSGEYERKSVKADGTIENNGNVWCGNCNYYVKTGLWVEVTENEVIDFIQQKEKEKEEKRAIKFPIYYRHKTHFVGDSMYIKRISEGSFNIIDDKGGNCGLKYTWDRDLHDLIVKYGGWIEVPESEVLDFIASVTVTGANSTLVKKEEEEMKKETAIAVGKTMGKFVGTWGFRAANYWLFEPATNLGRPIVKGVRYAVFLSSLSAAVYGYNHPDVVMNAVKSCLPKITIEAPEVLKG